MLEAAGSGLPAEGLRCGVAGSWRNAVGGWVHPGTGGRDCRQPVWRESPLSTWPRLHHLGAINQPLEANGVPPRVAQIDTDILAFSLVPRSGSCPPSRGPFAWIATSNMSPGRPALPAAHRKRKRSGTARRDILEKLRPLVSQLHHKIDLKPDEPLLEIVLIGYAPKQYGPEVWLIEYRVEQESVGSQADYLQTRPLRPRFTQLYPRKSAKRTHWSKCVSERLPGCASLGAYSTERSPHCALEVLRTAFCELNRVDQARPGAKGRQQRFGRFHAGGFAAWRAERTSSRELWARAHVPVDCSAGGADREGKTGRGQKSASRRAHAAAQANALRCHIRLWRASRCLQNDRIPALQRAALKTRQQHPASPLQFLLQTGRIASITRKVRRRR